MALPLNRYSNKGSTNQGALPPVQPVAPVPVPTSSDPVAGKLGALAQLVASAQTGTAASNQFAVPEFGSLGVAQAEQISPIAPQQPGIPATTPSDLASLFGGAVPAAAPAAGLSDYGLEAAPEFQGMEVPGAEVGMPQAMPGQAMPQAMPGPMAAPQAAAPITGATTLSDLVARGLGVTQEPQAQIGPDGLPVAPPPPVPRIPQLPPMPQLTPPAPQAPRVPQLPPMPQLPTPTGPQLMPQAQARVDLANAPTAANWASQLQAMAIQANPNSAYFGIGGAPAPSQPSPYGNPQAPNQSVQALPGSQAPGGVQESTGPYQPGQAGQAGQARPPVLAAPAAGQAPAPAVDPVVADLQRQVAELQRQVGKPRRAFLPSNESSIPAEADRKSREVNPEEDYPEVLASRRATQRADGGSANEPGQPYDPGTQEPAPIDQPSPIDQPAGDQDQAAPGAAFAGSPLLNAKPEKPMISGGNLGRPSTFGNISGNIPPEKLGMAGLSGALLAQFVEEAQIGAVNWYKRDVQNEQDAASLIYEFVKNRAQEEAVVLILDAQNRPISILRHQMGSDGGTSFSANIIAGTVAATPGAKKVYVAHNHPGRGTTYSDADIGTHYHIGKLLANVGVDFKGGMILSDANYDLEGKDSPKFLFTPGGKGVLADLARYAAGRPANNDPQAQDIPMAADRVPKNPSTDDREGFNPELNDEQNFERFAARDRAGLFEIPIVERVFTVRGRSLAKVKIEGHNAHKEIAPLLQNKPGLAFLDASLGLMAVLPLSVEDMSMLISYVSRSRRRSVHGKPIQLGAASLKIAPINDANGKTNGGEGLGRGKPAYESNPLARILAVYAKTNAKRLIIHLGEIDVDRIREDYIAGNAEVIDENSGWDGASNGDIIDAVENLKRGIKESDLELLDITNNYQSFGSNPFELGTPIADETKAPIDTVFPATDEGQKALRQDQTPGAVRNLKRPLRPDGTRTSIREEGDKYEPADGIEGIVRGGLNPDEGVNETNPEDPNAGAEFARQEREAGARVNADMPSSLEGVTDIAPLIPKATPKKRVKKTKPVQGSAADPSVFPRTLTPALKFGRWSGEQLKEFGLSDAMLDQFVEHATVGHIMSGVEFVKNANDAAHIVSYLRRKPVEEIVVLVTDKDGRPLHVTKHSTAGLATACVFNLPILVGSAASTPGAATMYFIHNHPSRKAFLSPADQRAGARVENLVKAAGLKFGGMIAVAGDQFAAQTSVNGRPHAGVPIKPMLRKFKVPLTERQFAFHVGFKGKRIENTSASSTLGAEVFGAQPGVIFLDNNYRPVATLPLSMETLAEMRKPDSSGQTGYGKFVATTERSAGLYMVLYLGDVDPDPRGSDGQRKSNQVAGNFARMVGMGGDNTRLLHITNLNGDNVSADNRYGDFDETGDDYRPGLDKPASLRDVVDQAAKKKNELEVGEGEPDAGSMVKMGELERSWRESMAAKKEAEANATFSADGVRVNHDNQALADQGFITHRASLDMARIMERINKRFPDGYPFYKNGEKELKKVANLKLRYAAYDGRIYGFESQDYVYIDAVFEDGTAREIASLDLMRGYGSQPESPTNVTKVGMSHVNTDLQLMGLGSILYVEAGERLRRMGQRYITGSVINAAAVATRVRAFPAGSTELLAIPGSSNMSQKEMAAAALQIIKGGTAAYTKTTLDPDVALEPAAGYDDGENTIIPGGAREAKLKQQHWTDRLPATYISIGHGPGRQGQGEFADQKEKEAYFKNVYLYFIDKTGRIQITENLFELSQVKIPGSTTNLGAGRPDRITHGTLFLDPKFGGIGRDHKGFMGAIAMGRIENRNGQLVMSFTPGIRRYENRQPILEDGNLASDLTEAIDNLKVEAIKHFKLKASSSASVTTFDRTGGLVEEPAMPYDDGSAREPGAAYDDGENQAIPGGGRQAWLKKQAALRAKNELPGAKRIQWWTDIGHKGGKKNREKTWLWAYDTRGKLQVINADELRTKMMGDGDSLGATPTHLDWEEAYFPGLLAGTAHGRIDATGDVVRISMHGRIQDPTFREQVKQELSEYIGVEVDRVKGYDFTGDGMPELFNRTEPGSADEVKQLAQDLKGMDLDEAKAYFKENPDKVLLMSSMSNMPPHLERILKAMRDVGYNDAKKYLEAHPLGKLLLANGRIVLVRHASEIPGLSPLEAATGGFNAVVLGSDREATYFVGDGISEAEIDALIKHEIGVHMGIGKDTDMVNDLFSELRTLVETGEAGDIDRIMAAKAMSDAFEVVAGHYGRRSDPSNDPAVIPSPMQTGDRILDKIYRGLDSSGTRYTDKRITEILKSEGLNQDQIDNFMRVFREETLGYLMNIMATRDAGVNAPKDSLLKMVIQYIKAAMIRMAYANSQGNNRLVAGAVMGTLKFGSAVAGVFGGGLGGEVLGFKALSKILAITPGDVRAIAQGYVKAYAAGKEVGMPDTRWGTVEQDAQNKAKDAQALRAAGRTGDPVTDAATFSNTLLFSFRKPGQPAPTNDKLSGTKEAAARFKDAPKGPVAGAHEKEENLSYPPSSAQEEVGHAKWVERKHPEQSEVSVITHKSGVIPLSQALNPTGPTRDSSLLVSDDGVKPAEFPRVSSIAAISGQLGDLAAQLDIPVHIPQGRQFTGKDGKFGEIKGKDEDVTDDGQMLSGFGLEHASWKHGWEMDALAVIGGWEKGNHMDAIRKIMKDASDIGVMYKADGSVGKVMVFSQKTQMRVVLQRVGGDSPFFYVVTAMKLGNAVKKGKPVDAERLKVPIDREAFMRGLVSFSPKGAPAPRAFYSEAKNEDQTNSENQANEPGADYGQAEQTGEQQAAAEAKTLEKLREAQGNGPAGPNFLNAIPPTPPPPAPTAPAASPAPAPLTPPVTNEDVARRVGDALRGRYFDGISTKAHQNAERTGSAAVRAVAGIIHTRGGREDTSTQRDLPKAVMTARAKYQNKFNNIMAPLREQLGRMTSEQREQFYRDLVDQITGRTNIQPGTSGHAATGLINLLKELHDYRIAAGEQLGEVQQYFPAVYNSAIITANKAAFIADATRAYEMELSQDPNLTPQEIQAKAVAAAEALYRTHTRGMGDAEWASIFKGPQDSATENSSKERVFGRQAQGIMSKWQSPDPFHVISRYIGSSAKRAELVRRFGPEGEKWEAMADAMEAEGASIEVINEMADLVKLSVGLGMTPLGTGERMFMDAVNLYTAAGALGKSAMNNLFEPGSIGNRAATIGNPVRIVEAYAETWTRFIRNLVQMLPVLGDHVGPTFWQEYGEHIGSIHNSLDDAWMSMHAMEHGMEESSPRMRWLTNRVYMANLMESTENAKLQASHSLGHAYILDNASMLDGSHYIPRLLKFDTRSTAEEALRELGIPMSKQDAFAAWAATLKATKDRATRMAMLTDGSEMSLLYEEAQLRFSHQAAVRANRAHKPIFQDAVLGRLALQLMSYTYSYFSEVTSRMYTMAKRAITTKDMPAIQRINMMLPVMLSPLTVIAMHGLFESKDYLFPTESSEKRKKDHWIYKLFNTASFAGMFNPKIEMAAKYISRDQPPGGIAGQTLVAGARVAKKGIELSLDDTKSSAEKEAALKKAAARAAIAPIKASAVITGSAINPVLGAVAVAATNETGWSNELQDVETPKKGTTPAPQGLPKYRK